LFASRSVVLRSPTGRGDVRHSQREEQSMRRSVWIASLATALALVALIGLKFARSPAQPVNSSEAETAVPRLPAPRLPVQRVLLFSSGVGYFQREGDVEGTTRVDLSFPVQDINDLLKSLVLLDRNGGQVSAVSYDSPDPVNKTLQSFAVNLTGNPTFAQVLDQTRGERVEVVLQPGNGNPVGTLNGTVMGIERQRQAGGKDAPVEVELLNLWCADGMRGVRLADVQRLRFLNPVIEGEVKRALHVLASSRDSQKKVISLTFTGEGKRHVQVSYVVENPMWKTSYRLVLGKDGKALLQGWAVVENATDEDWTNVRLALISGRPISFQMDLYEPLYVPRPVVEPELFASLRPPTYGGPIAGTPPNSPAVTGVGSGLGVAERENAAEDASSPVRRGAIPRPLPGAPPPMPAMGIGGLGGGGTNQGWGGLPSLGVTAQETELGHSFQYAIEKPVSLPRHKSALLPIVQKEIKTTPVSIYSVLAHAKFPLLGLKFHNTTGLNLMQGPITVFEGDRYGGDSRILDLQPNEERLLSFAIDLDMEVEPVAKEPSFHPVAVTIKKGVLSTAVKRRETLVYNVKSRSRHDRTLLIEHAYRSDFQLVNKDKPAERTREVYRFEVKVPAGKTATQEVVEEKEEVKPVPLTNADEAALRVLLNSPGHSPRVKAALEEAVQRKAKLSAAQRDLAQQEKQLAAINADQTRLRANLKEMPATAAAYKRYLDKFDSQETEIEKLQARIQELQQAEHAQRQEYEAFLNGLNVE
jgi:hypothetical protein